MWHSNHILFQHTFPIRLKERIGAAQDGQIFQIQEGLEYLLPPQHFGNVSDKLVRHICIVVHGKGTQSFQVVDDVDVGGLAVER